MSYTCRQIDENEFTSELESFVIETFFQHEPMNKHLDIKIPDEIDLPWLRQVLAKASQNNLSLAFYDNHRQLPIAYAINHGDIKDDDNHHQSDQLYASPSVSLPISIEDDGQQFEKYQHISFLMSKLHSDIDLFKVYNAQKLFHVYLLGVDPVYRQHKLASRLIDASIALARKQNFDIIYAEVTGDYSLNAFIKHDFQILKTIDYSSYEDPHGRRIFQDIEIHKGCSIVVKDLRTE